MRKYLSLIFAAALLFLASCEEKYVARVTELRVIRIDPSSGYAGSVINILGRNFSTSFGENQVLINGKEARIVEFTKDQITVIAPENEMGSYSVEVRTPLGRISREDLIFTYKKKPDKLFMVTTVAGDGSNQLRDELGTSAALGQIEGLSWAPDGSIWFCQRSAGNAVRSYNPETSMVRTVVTPIPLPWSGDFDASGDFYFPGKDARKIYRIPKGSSSCEEISLDGSVVLDNPMCVRFDPGGNMWIASRNNHTVYKVHDGVLVKSFTGDRYFPVALAVDARGRVFFSSNQDRGVFRIEADEVSKVIGSGTTPNRDNYAESLNSGPAGANVGNIGGMYFDSRGHLYYTDNLTCTVVKVTADPEGDYSAGTISIVAGIPFSSAVVNGTSDIAQFKYPSGIVVSADGKKIYVSEPTGYVLRVIDTS